jgi:hypothetical protein
MKIRTDKSNESILLELSMPTYAYTALIQICTIKIVLKTTFRTVFRQSCAVFCRNLRICDLRISHKNVRI